MDNTTGKSIIHGYNIGQMVWWTDFWGTQTGDVIGITLDRVKVSHGPHSDGCVQYWIDPSIIKRVLDPLQDLYVQSGAHGTYYQNPQGLPIPPWLQDKRIAKRSKG